jgi:cyclomaltodextrinase
MLLQPASGQSPSPGEPHVPGWVRDAVFYQIFPERFANGDTSNDPPGTEPWGGTPTSRNYFGGDLRGIIQRLDYISQLGVNAVYLNPIFTSPTNHKYQTTDYMTIDPHFGDAGVFREFIDACHARGIRVILDGVFNHSGVQFFAFDDVKRNGAASPYRNWYTVHGFPVGPPSRPNYECWWGHGHLPKLATDYPEVRAYLFDVTRHWMAAGIDGWRLDVPNEISHDFWISWRSLVKSINPEAYIVGEIWQDGSPWLHGDQFDAVMNYRFRDACLQFFAHDSISVMQFDSLLERQRNDYAPAVNFALQNLLGSHDTERFLTLCKGDTAALTLAWLFQMTYPGAPMIYYGDEIGMEGGRDPGCRKTMVWEASGQNAALLGLMKSLTTLRNEQPVLRHAPYERVLADNRNRTLVYARRTADTTALVFINRSARQRKIGIPRPAGEGTLRQAWPPERMEWAVTGDSITATLGPMTGVVLIGAK